MSAVLLGNSVMNILSASLTTAVLTAIFGAAGVVYATVIVGILVVDVRRGDAQDLGAAARRPHGAGAGALDPRSAWRCWARWRAPSPGSARVFLAAMGVQVDRTHDAEEHDELLRGAIETAWHGRHGRGRAGREGDAALGARSRRSHGRRRHDPSRQRRADRRRRARRIRSWRRCWRRPTPASRSIAASPTTCRRDARQGPVPRGARRRRAGGRSRSRTS